MKRRPMMITTRCMLNGAEMHILLYVRPDQDAYASARRYWPQRERPLVRGIDVRPATDVEISTHTARLAALMSLGRNLGA